MVLTPRGFPYSKHKAPVNIPHYRTETSLISCHGVLIRAHGKDNVCRLLLVRLSLVMAELSNVGSPKSSLSRDIELDIISVAPPDQVNAYARLMSGFKPCPVR